MQENFNMCHISTSLEKKKTKVTEPEVIKKTRIRARPSASSVNLGPSLTSRWWRSRTLSSSIKKKEKSLRTKNNGCRRRAGGADFGGGGDPAVRLCGPRRHLRPPPWRPPLPSQGSAKEKQSTAGFWPSSKLRRITLESCLSGVWGLVGDRRRRIWRGTGSWWASARALCSPKRRQESRFFFPPFSNQL